MRPPYNHTDFALPKVVAHTRQTLTFTCERCDGVTVEATVNRLFAIANHGHDDTPNMALRRIMAAYQNIASPLQITAI